MFCVCFPNYRPVAAWAVAILFASFLCRLNGGETQETAKRGSESNSAISFSRDIRPLLADNCFACHGFDEKSREAGLRLDTRLGATMDLGGRTAIMPGRPEQSELIRRVTTSDEDELMPPSDSHRQRLSQAAVDLLSEWIRQGAPWSEHWSFVKPEKVSVPHDQHPVDHFVIAQLSSQSSAHTQWQLAPMAEPHTLARRLAFDLLGLPANAEQIERIQRQADDETWLLLVNEMLESPHFGERMAMWWLDGARYSDTDGFQQDAVRSNWPWRDWVVAAFNHNMPFDQFTIEQFAGDLLPNANDAQRLATCFHRNHMHNGEGGRDPEESRVDYVLDRVNTMGTLWMGLTLGCTQCHDHKFDPISQKDYYSLSAYFNSIDETGAAGEKAEPFLDWTSPIAMRDVRQNEILVKDLEEKLAVHRGQAAKPFAIWLDQQIALVAEGFEAWRPVQISELKSTEGYHLSTNDGVAISSAPSQLPQDDFIVTCAAPKQDRITAVRLRVFPHAAHTEGKLSYSPSGEFILTNVKLRLRKSGSTQYRELPIVNAIADVDGVGVDPKYAGVAGTLDDDPRTGWTTRTHPADVAHWAIFELAEPLTMAADEVLDIILMQRSIENRETIGRFSLSTTNQRGPGLRSREPLPIESLAKVVGESSPESPIEVSVDLRQQLFDQFLEDDAEHADLQREMAIAKSQLAAARKAAQALKVTVLRERPEPRRTYVLNRGVWDNHGDEVRPGVLPIVLAKTPSTVPTRLELGKWVVSPDNPLTARVIVNQVWQMFFGSGLVRTPSDFGLQGELPTHPQLLDWLAVDFMQSGWDLKHLVRTIVTSKTYRQSSSASQLHRELDPENRLLARGARFRLPAWMIRDSRLALSGLLNRDIGGPPIFPYQPDGVWRDQFMGRISYQATLGAGQYRRTVYAFWRRSSAPAFLFDAAMRRNCEVAQYRTNTPLHALNLLNDLTGQEAARNLADEFLRTATTDRLATHALWKHCLGREATPVELSLLNIQYENALRYYQQHPQAGTELLCIGQLASVPTEKLAERAALMVIATLILNLDECITHE